MNQKAPLVLVWVWYPPQHPTIPPQLPQQWWQKRPRALCTPLYRGEGRAPAWPQPCPARAEALGMVLLIQPEWTCKPQLSPHSQPGAAPTAVPFSSRANILMAAPQLLQPLDPGAAHRTHPLTQTGWLTPRNWKTEDKPAQGCDQQFCLSSQYLNSSRGVSWGNLPPKLPLKGVCAFPSSGLCSWLRAPPGCAAPGL